MTSQSEADDRPAEDLPAEDRPAADPAAETTPFDTPSDYAAALDRALALAAHEILVFDDNLALGNWGSVARVEMLRQFLLSHRRARLQIVVHETRHIEQSLPRLTGLLRPLSHKFEILKTIGEGRNARDGFTLVDNRHLVHRFHFDTKRGELSLDDPRKTAVLRERYNEILGFTESGVNATQLGL
jgi:hypothetical protein